MLPSCGAVCRGGALLRPKPFRFLSVISYRGKSPEKPKRFFWSVQGSLRGNRNPLRLFFFCQRFLLEKQKKMLCRTCKFAAVHRPLCSFPETPEASPMRGSCRRRRLMRWTTPRRRKYPHLIRHGSAVPPSPHRGRHLVPAKRCRPTS